MARPKPHTLTLPWDPEQVANLEAMLEMLFADVATGGVTLPITIPDDITGVLDVEHGGTGMSVYAIGDILFANAVDSLTTLAAAAAGNALLSGVNPSWGKVGLTTHVSGILPVANGGTGLAAYTIGDLIYASGAAALAVIPIGAANKVLVSNGAGLAPSWGEFLHNLLSATHGDTVAADPRLGDLIVAQGAPGSSDVWFDGLPVDGISAAIDTGGAKYWFDGLPVDYMGTTVKWRRLAIGAVGTKLTSNGSGVEWT